MENESSAFKTQEITTKQCIITKTRQYMCFSFKNRIPFIFLTLKNASLQYEPVQHMNIQHAGLITKTARPRIKASGLRCLSYNEKCFTIILFTGLLGTGVSLDISAANISSHLCGGGRGGKERQVQ